MSNKLIFLLLSLFFITELSAVEVESLYHVEVQVDDQSTANRQTATIEAFKEVLIRKSGSDNILSSNEVNQAYRKVISYLQRFEYSRNKNYQPQINKPVIAKPQSDDRNLALDQSIQNKPYILMLDFEPRLIDELIQLSGMPIWGSNRPQTIFWLAIEENNQRRMIKNESDDNRYADLIKQNGVRRGIPLMLPIMDLDDQQNVNISDVWGRFNSTLVQATERYAADTIVLGRVNQTDSNWKAKLTYLSNDEESIIEIESQTIEGLFNNMTNRVADLLCQKYCVVELAERHQVIMQISNVTNFKNYIKINNYLASLSAIRSVEVDAISGVNLTLKLSLLGDIQAVNEALSLNSHLLQDSPPIINQVETINQPDNLGFKLNADANGTFNSNPDSNPDSIPKATTDIESNPQIVTDNTSETNNITAENLVAETNNKTEEKPPTLYYRWVE